MMQLRYLLPHLDAEIERLQRARDLLALISSSRFSPANDSPLPIAGNLPEQQGSSSPNGAHFSNGEQSLGPALVVTHPGTLPALHANGAADHGPHPIRRRRRRSDAHDLDAQRQPKVTRRKRAVVEDTALTGAVPAGPVVISAEQVRQSQALKAAEALRIAEAKKSGADLSSPLGWRNRATDVRSVEALLQRLINLGAEDGDKAAANHISSHR